MATTEPQYSTLKEFWPFYLSQHVHPVNRMLHFIGSSGVLLLIGISIWQKNPYWLFAAPVCGYGFAWVGHFLIEKNKPATFTYPIKSLISDWIMYYYILTFQIQKEIQKIPTS